MKHLVRANKPVLVHANLFKVFRCLMFRLAVPKVDETLRRKFRSFRVLMPIYCPDGAHNPCHPSRTPAGPQAHSQPTRRNRQNRAAQAIRITPITLK
jgi:hypothetical protein